MIEVRQLTKVYGETKAIDALDFSVERGEIVGFLGPNGAGKSTTMRILCGALGATQGEARIGGFDVLTQPRKTKALVGYLPEVPPVYPDMTVRSFLRFCARLKGVSPVETAVDRVLGQVGLTGVAHRLIGHLSKGFRQRVGIAQALVHRPAVLILDEPTSGLDPAQRVEIRDLVRELAQGETTVVLSTHVLSEIESVCGRVIILHRGRIVAQDRISELHLAGRRVRVVVARPPADLAAQLGALPGVNAVRVDRPGVFEVGASVDIREQVAAAVVPHGLLELAAPGALEEVFLRLTSRDGTTEGEGA